MKSKKPRAMQMTLLTDIGSILRLDLIVRKKVGDNGPDSGCAFFTY
jgi:hypothetical protein